MKTENWKKQQPPILIWRTEVLGVQGLSHFGYSVPGIQQVLNKYWSDWGKETSKGNEGNSHFCGLGRYGKVCKMLGLKRSVDPQGSLLALWLGASSGNK